MSPAQLRDVQAKFSAIVTVLMSLDLEGASELMENVAKYAKVQDPLVWAKSKDAHTRMRAMVDAGVTFQKTVANIKTDIDRTRERAPSPIILPS